MFAVASFLARIISHRMPEVICGVAHADRISPELDANSLDQELANQHFTLAFI
jgi:hypothetical protein